MARSEECRRLDQNSPDYVASYLHVTEDRCYLTAPNGLFVEAEAAYHAENGVTPEQPMLQFGLQHLIACAYRGTWVSEWLCHSRIRRTQRDRKEDSAHGGVATHPYRGVCERGL